MGYPDLTGNVSVRTDQPAALVRTVGAEEDPNPTRRSEVTLRGAGAGRVVRRLTDVTPPSTAIQVASRAGLVDRTHDGQAVFLAHTPGVLTALPLI